MQGGWPEGYIRAGRLARGLYTGREAEQRAIHVQGNWPEGYTRAGRLDRGLYTCRETGQRAIHVQGGWPEGYTRAGRLARGLYTCIQEQPLGIWTPTTNILTVSLPSCPES